MTIWILAFLLLASLAGLGYRQGAIRVSASLLGILFGALFAVPLAKLTTPILKILGVSQPVLLWVLGPFVGFCVVLMIFKSIGYAVHNKVEVYYRYKTSDLRQSLFERLNARLGLCLGLVNGLAYFILISFVIYGLSYWTIQMASGDEDARSVRLINRLGKDLETTGMHRVAAGVGSLPETFFQAADLAGLLYHHALLEARLARYPGLLSLGERPEIGAIGRDPSFTDLRLKVRPVREILALPTVQGVTQNPEMLRLVWDTLKPDLVDLRTFLETGKSARYDHEEILGRWYFDVAGSVMAFRRDKPNLPGTEVQKTRRWLAERFANTGIVVTPEKTVYLKNLPVLRATPGQPLTPETKSYQGKWSKTGDDYYFSLSGTEEIKASVGNGRLTFNHEGFVAVFAKED